MENLARKALITIVFHAHLVLTTLEQRQRSETCATAEKCRACAKPAKRDIQAIFEQIRD